MAYSLTYAYNSTSESYTVTGYSNITTSDEVVIPSTYDDGTNGEHPVTEIGSSAFRDCSSLTSITIPNSVTSIGSSAFYNCSSLTSVYITDIAAWCKISFGSYAANPLYYAHNLYLNNELVTELTIPYSIMSIGSYAFYNCSSLTSVTIGSGVTSIGDDAFDGCSSLTRVTIGNSVTSIGSSAFRDCSSLTSITIPNSVTSIGSYAFYNCSSLTSVYITDIAAWCKISFGSYAANPLYYAHNLYLNNELVTELTIPYSIMSIGSYAFYNCSSLTSVTIGSGVTSIGDDAFDGCSSLTRVTIGNSVTSIGSSAFYNCSSLTSVTIGNSVTSIGSYAFRDCSSLTNITIPDGVTSIGSSAFRDCSNLKQLILLPSTPPTLGSSAIPSTISKIYVQQSSKTVYQAATNWTTFASKIVSDNIYLSFARFNQKNKEYIEKKINDNGNDLNLENGTAEVLVQTTDSNHSFKVMADGRAKVQTAPKDNDDVVRKLELDRKFDKSGGTVTGDMVVGGNFTVQGKTTTVDNEHLRVTDKLIEVGKGNTAPLTSPAGLITPKYDGTNNGGIVYDHTGTAYVGDITLDSNGNVDVNNSDLQPIATRNATITNDNLVKWDSENFKLIDAGKNVESLVDKLPASLRSQVYIRNANGEDTGLAYTYTDEGNTLAFRNAGGQLQVSNPSQDKDAANKSYADNLNARYVSTSILGG